MAKGRQKGGRRRGAGRKKAVDEKHLMDNLVKLNDKVIDFYNEVLNMEGHYELKEKVSRVIINKQIADKVENKLVGDVDMPPKIIIEMVDARQNNKNTSE